MRGKTGADREISVNTYTGGFTTMLNHHLRNRNLSLKAVGLLSKMLSLPPDWDYSIRGLATLNTDGIDGIRTAMKELEDEGYVVRVQSRDERGRMSRNKYTVYALPQKEKPSPDLPSSENPTTVKPPPDEPMTEKPTQINTNQVIPKKRNDSLSKYQSINPDGMDAMDERERYEEIIRENLEVDILSQDSRYDIDRVNEIIEVMLDAICSTSPTLRVNNTDNVHQKRRNRDRPCRSFRFGRSDVKIGLALLFVIDALDSLIDADGLIRQRNVLHLQSAEFSNAYSGKECNENASSLPVQVHVDTLNQSLLLIL